MFVNLHYLQVAVRKAVSRVFGLDGLCGLTYLTYAPNGSFIAAGLNIDETGPIERLQRLLVG